jgi:hypothetical protein
MRLQPVSKQLVAGLLPLTTHKRYRVRVAALRALGPLMHQVGWRAAPETADRLLR